MVEKLSAMQMEGICLKECRGTAPVGRNESWLKIKSVQRAKFPIVSFVKDSAGVAALHIAKREGKDFVYVKSAPASIENHHWKSARSLMRS